MDIQYQQIISDLTTLSEAQNLTTQLEKLQHDLYTKNVPLEQKIIQTFGFKFENALLEILSTSKENLNQVETILKNIQTQIKELPIMTIQIAINITTNEVNQIKNWCQSNLAQKHLLKIIIEPQIIGGIKIWSDGQFYDYSVQKELTNAKSI